MGHDHQHHMPASLNMNRAFIIGIILNVVFVVLEAVAGFYFHSLSLLSDAGHNLADVGTLLLSLVAFKLVKIKSNERYTYGYKKTSILAALLNSVILLISIGVIAYEAIRRFINPQPVPGLDIALIAGIGIIINFSSALLFFKGKDDDLNVKSAYLHLLSDALVSLVIVIGGVAIYFLKWFWLDPFLSLVVVVVILISTWHLLRDSLRLSLDGVPSGISLTDIKEMALKVKGILDLHHIHIWAMSTTENALTAHLVLAPDINLDQELSIKKELKHQLEHKNIHHITLEVERRADDCDDKDKSAHRS
ncbi:MAG: cation diffusion facilitator family transporter [Ginsengibacter sp.]